MWTAGGEAGVTRLAPQATSSCHVTPFPAAKWAMTMSPPSLLVAERYLTTGSVSKVTSALRSVVGYAPMAVGYASTSGLFGTLFPAAKDRPSLLLSPHGE